MTIIAEEARTPTSSHFKDDFHIRLLNAIKNRRRVKIAQILLEGPLDIYKLQQRLKMEGYYHSRSTIRKHYVGPMLKVGILSEESNMYRLTDEGRRMVYSLGDVDLKDFFPSSSKCYEEECLLLLQEPKKYNELLTYIPNMDLQRTIRRLKTKGLIIKLKPNRYVTYRITTKETEVPLSETEKKVLRSISNEGVSVAEISKKIGISVRRTFKYLKRLKEKGLVSSSTNFMMLSLTDEGKRLAENLRKILGITDVVFPATQPDMEKICKESLDETEETKHEFELSKHHAIPLSKQSRFATKRDMREKLLYGLVLNSGERGVIQAKIGTLLNLPSRDISRIISRLESWKLIRKERVLFNGRNTFRIVSTRKPPSLNSILGAPCITCVNAKKCEKGNERDIFGRILPQECLSLERWIMNIEPIS